MTVRLKRAYEQPDPSGGSRFPEFRRRYRNELTAQEDKLRELREHARGGTLTLVYTARDTDHSDAVVLAELLKGI